MGAQVETAVCCGLLEAIGGHLKTVKWDYGVTPRPSSWALRARGTWDCTRLQEKGKPHRPVATHSHTHTHTHTHSAAVRTELYTWCIIANAFGFVE